MKKLFCLTVVLLSAFISAVPAFALRESTPADKAFVKGDYQTAAGLYESILASNPNNVRALRFLGLSYLYTGNFDGAITTLNRAKQIDPSSAAIRYYLAQAYYAQGQADMARQELTYIIAELPEGAYHKKARSLEEQMALRPKAHGRYKPISVYQKVGFQYDSNVMLEPQKLGIKGLDKDSSRFTNYTWVELVGLQDDGWRAGANFSYYQSLHTENDSKPFNLSSFDFGPFFSFDTPVSDKILKNRIEYRYIYDILSGESFVRTHSIRARTGADLVSWLNATIFYEVNFDDFFYRQRPANKDYLNRDAVRTKGGMRLQFNLPHRRFIYCGYDYTHNDSEGLLWNYERNRLFAELATPFFVPDLTLFVLGEYSNRYFDPYLGSFYVSKAERDEDYWSFRIKMRYDVTSFASVETSYRYIKQEATIEEFFEYERQIFDFSLVFRY